MSPPGVAPWADAQSRSEGRGSAAIGIKTPVSAGVLLLGIAAVNAPEPRLWAEKREDRRAALARRSPLLSGTSPPSRWGCRRLWRSPVWLGEVRDWVVAELCAAWACWLPAQRAIWAGDGMRRSSGIDLENEWQPSRRAVARLEESRRASRCEYRRARFDTSGRPSGRCNRWPPGACRRG